MLGDLACHRTCGICAAPPALVTLLCHLCVRVREAKLQGINAAGAALDHADFTGANFAPAEPSKPSETPPTQPLVAADSPTAPGTTAQDVIQGLTNALAAQQLSQQQLPQQPDLTPSNLSGVSARNTKFTGATLTRVRFDNSNLAGAVFETTNISGASMNNAKFGTYSMPARPQAKQQTRGTAGRLTTQLGKAIVEAADSDEDSCDDDEDNEEEGNDEADAKVATQTLLQASLTKSVERLASAAAKAVPQVIAASQKADQAIDKAVEKAKEALDSKTGGEAQRALESALRKAASCTDRTVAATAIGDLMQKELNSLLNEVFGEAGTLSELLTEAKVEVVGAVEEVSGDAGKLAQGGAELGLPHVLKMLRRTVEKHADPVLKKLASTVAEEIGGRFAPSAAAAQRLVEAEQLLDSPADTYREALKNLLDRVEACLDNPEDVVQQWLLQQGGKLLQGSTGGRGGLATLGRRTTIFEKALASKLDTEQAKVASTKSLGDQLNARVRSQLAKRALAGTSRYAATGHKAMFNLVVSTDPLVMTKHEKELTYLLEKLAKLEDADVTSELWQDFYESWVSFLALRSQLEAECAQQIFEAVATDEAVLTGLAGAHLFKDAVMESGPGQVPNELLVQLKQGPGKHIKSFAYAYRHKIDAELTRIGRIRGLQQRAVALTGTAIISVSVGTCNVLGQLYYDVLQSNGTLAGMIAGVAISAVLLACITFAACVRRVRK